MNDSFEPESIRISKVRLKYVRPGDEVPGIKIIESAKIDLKKQQKNDLHS
jgi:hypothetical protein